MELCVDAPLAPIELDILSDDSSTHCGPVHCTLSDGSLPTEQSDLDQLCSGSLTDLVLNFDDRVYQCLTKSVEPQTSDVAPAIREATLSDVKFWWKEAVEETIPLQYPFGTAPDKVGVYEEFEVADADGITEDENLCIPIIRSHGVWEDDLQAEREASFQGHVTTDSQCSSSISSRALTPDRSLSPCMEHLDEVPCNQNTSSSPSVTFPPELQTTLNQLLTSHRTPLPLTDFTRFSMDHLLAYKEALLAIVLSLSDRLVELLAMRDELTMLREASDDFIILLDLVHQRRARASRAALLATARGRIRPKGFARLKLPWITRSLFGTPSGSLSSLSEHSAPKLQQVIPATAVPLRLTADTDTVAMNTSTGSVAYYKSLNLQSKQRRPRAQPIAAMRQPLDETKLNGVISSPSHPCNGASPSREFPLYSSTSISDRSHERLLILRKLCHTLAWPNGQPHLSKSLSLSIPYDARPAEGISLSMLRRLNQILHGALLENSATEDMVNAYVDTMLGQNQVACWVEQVNNHVDFENPVSN